MAGLTVAITHSFVIGDRLAVVADVTCDSDYTIDTGEHGYPLLPATLGFSELDFVKAGVSIPTAHTAGYDYTNQSLHVYVAGVEVGDGVNIATAVFRLFAVGKGFPRTGP